MDIGFALGPRINAAGRLDDMTRGVETLLTTNKAQAVTFADELDQLNQQRRSIERSMRGEAEQHYVRKLLLWNMLKPV